MKGLIFAAALLIAAPAMGQDSEAVSGVQLCNKVQSSELPVGCAVFLEDGKTTVVIRFASAADFETFGPTVSSTIFAKLCQQTDFRARMILSVIVGGSDYANRMDCFGNDTGWLIID